MSDERPQEGPPGEEGEVLSARFGRSANCSSVGSVVDLLFVSSVVGTAVLGALAVMVRGAGDAPERDTEGRVASENEDENPPREG